MCHVYIYIYIYIYLSISLSLCIYIYIYTYTHIQLPEPHEIQGVGHAVQGQEEVRAGLVGAAGQHGHGLAAHIHLGRMETMLADLRTRAARVCSCKCTGCTTKKVPLRK